MEQKWQCSYACGMAEAENKSVKNILEYLRTRPSHPEVEVNGRNFYLVHAWLGEDVHDEVWHQPVIDAPNPKTRVSGDHWTYDGADHDLAGRSKKAMP